MDRIRDPLGTLLFRQVFVMTSEILGMQAIGNNLLPGRQIVKMRRAFRSQDQKHTSIVAFGLIPSCRSLKHHLRYFDLGL